MMKNAKVFMHDDWAGTLIEDEDGYFDEVDVVQRLFNEVAPRYADRPGGYTRLVKIGKRPGDNAEMAVLMLVEED